MNEITDPHIQWEYMTVYIRNRNDIASELNLHGKYGWECFHIDITVYGVTAILKRINYSAMRRKRLEDTAKATNTTIDKIMKSELLNKIND